MQLKPLKGQHHVSAITNNGKQNYQFYTKVLGLRLVKKSVNQDDTSVYHLFYADEKGNPGTDLTFFEFPAARRAQHGTNSISTTSLRVPNNKSIQYWKQRFEQLDIDHNEITLVAGRATIAFRDEEGQRLALVSDEHNAGVAGGKPWERSPVPIEHAIVGLGPVTLTVSRPELTVKVLTEVMGYREKAGFPSNHPGQSPIRIFEIGEGGTGAEIHLEERKDLPCERQGSGSVHHVAFRVENEEELNKWVSYMTERGLPNSGFVERYYFRSLYFREPNGILFELATDGPGFESDEDFEHLGERLALPPFLEGRRASIEAGLEPLETKYTFMKRGV